MDTKHALPHTIDELIAAYKLHRLTDEMQAVDRLLRQLAVNWDRVVDDESQPGWDYPLTIPASELLLGAELRPADIEYIARVTHPVVVEPASGVTGLESDTNDQLFPEQCWALRQIFQDVKDGLTPDMISGLRTLLPDDIFGEFVIRPRHLPALRVLHLLLLRCGYWPKLLQDAWLNLAEAGYDPTSVPELTDAALSLAYTNREGELVRERPRVNDVTTFCRSNDDEGSEAYGDRLRHWELALMLMATLVDERLAAFSDVYWQCVERLEFA